MKNFNSLPRIAKMGIVVAFTAIAFVQAAVFYPPALVSLWQFDDAAGLAALDSAGANHGTLVNEPVWTTGQAAGALSFDGVNDYVQAPDSASLDIAGPEITIEAWVYPHSVAHENIILKKGSGGSGGCDNYNLFIRSGTLALLSSDSCSWGNAGPNALVSAGAWQHIAATYDGVDIRYYINGSLTDTVSQDGLGAVNNDPLTIAGPSIEGWADSRHFNGIVDEAALYSRVLTPAEIHRHYADGLQGLPYYSRQYSIEGLRSMVEEMDTREGIKQSLLKRADAASGKFEKRSYAQTVSILDSLINEIEALNGKELTQEQAEELVSYMEGLQELISRLF